MTKLNSQDRAMQKKMITKAEADHRAMQQYLNRLHRV